MKFKPTPKTKATPKKEADFKPSAEIGQSLFLKSLINLPYRALNLKTLTVDGKDSTLGRDLVAIMKDFELNELFDTNDEREMKTWDYVFNKFKNSVEYIKHEGFKESAELFVDQLS